MESSYLNHLGSEISRNAKLLSEALAESKQPEPSFQDGLPAILQGDGDSEIHTARQKLLQSTEELHALLSDPTLLLTPELRNPLPSLHAVVKLGIAEKFPSDGTSIQSLARVIGRSESLVRRLLSHCATHRIYLEKSPDFFVHTAASRILAEKPGMRDWILIGSEEMLPATLKTADALLKYPNSEEPEHSGWSVQNGTKKSIFKDLADQPARAARFARAMGWHAMQPGLSLDHLLSVFPCHRPGSLTVVDVGGGRGHVSRALVAHDSTITCVVEDFPDIIAQGEINLTPELASRLSFRAHDFFTEQPVKGADVYLLRLILHDWSDKYAIRILRALIPALRRGSKIVVQDRVIPVSKQVSLLKEREARDHDMYMLAFQNAKERTEDDWRALFRLADERLALVNVRQPARSHLALLEVVWEGS